MDGTGEHHPERDYPGPEDQNSYILSYVDLRSRANTGRGLDFGHMIRREHTREV
jgi:hypothetical protein